MNVTNEGTSHAGVPWHLWVVGLVSLLWNAFGAYLYTMANLDEAEMLAQMPPEMQEYAANMPLWAHTGWAVGVWASLAGAALLLARSRHAVTAFVVSAIGAAISYASQAMAGVLTPIEPLMILGAIALQWFYSKKMAAAGVLR